MKHPISLYQQLNQEDLYAVSLLVNSRVDITAFKVAAKNCPPFEGEFTLTAAALRLTERLRNELYQRAVAEYEAELKAKREEAHEPRPAQPEGSAW